MRRLILLVVVLFVGSAAMAQKIDSVVHNLASRNLSGSHVLVSEDGATREAVRIVEAQRRTRVISGFRIVIYSDNGQYAGDNAQTELTSFREKFPHINAYMVYESPYFKVSVGDCLSMEEAQILMAQLTPHYPKAFPKRENIRYEELYDARREARDTLAVGCPEVVIERNAGEAAQFFEENNEIIE
ncbi:MAG: hypothetical protein J6Q95_07165 [Alistipes sp.]|jgi:hypothetical protein|nr:hypothetical protein [Alistipes sp.]